MQSQSVKIPPIKIGFLKKNWSKIYTPIVELGGLQIRMNLKTNSIDLRTHENTRDKGNLMRAILFIDSLINGFPIAEALIAFQSDCNMCRFEIKHVKFLKGDHVDRAVGRVIGKNGVMKKNIERILKTKILISETTIFILGGTENIKIAKDIICRLIMGSEMTKINNRLKMLSGKLKEKYSSVEVGYNTII